MKSCQKTIFLCLHENGFLCPVASLMNVTESSSGTVMLRPKGRSIPCVFYLMDCRRMQTKEFRRSFLGLRPRQDDDTTFFR
jgi:hypothetical protein